MSWYTNAKLWSFVGGVAAACAGAAVSQSKAARSAAVTVLSKGMMAKEDAQECLQSIKDDAEDACADARAAAKKEAALSARRAEIEARIRAQVEAEMAAEEPQA